MNYKYTIGTETKEYEGVTLYRITGQDGVKGGWIQKESNLSQDGSCFVDGEAIVMENAKISGSANVCNNAVVRSNAFLFENADVRDNARVNGNAILKGNCYVGGDSAVSGNSTMDGDSSIIENAAIIDSHISEDASMTGNASALSSKIQGAAKINGNAIISSSTIRGNAIISQDSTITSSTVGNRAHIRNGIIKNVNILEPVIISFGETISHVNDYLCIVIGWGKEITITKKSLNWGQVYRKLSDWNLPKTKSMYDLGMKGRPTFDIKAFLIKCLTTSDTEFFKDIINPAKLDLIFNFIIRYTPEFKLSNEDRNSMAEKVGYNTTNVNFSTQLDRDIFFEYLQENIDRETIRLEVIKMLRS
jgi:carbonic anhydrase/acetyltransferase-like protein (isoleucine patch superfamily)